MGKLKISLKSLSGKSLSKIPIQMRAQRKREIYATKKNRVTTIIHNKTKLTQ